MYNIVVTAYGNWYADEVSFRATGFRFTLNLADVVDKALQRATGNTSDVDFYRGHPQAIHRADIRIVVSGPSIADLRDRLVKALNGWLNNNQDAVLPVVELQIREGCVTGMLRTADESIYF